MTNEERETLIARARERAGRGRGRVQVAAILSALDEARTDLDAVRRDRDDARATLSTRLALRREIEEALGIESGPASDEQLVRGVEALRALRADLARVTGERDEATKKVDEREGDMHARIRAEYDRTIADSWRAANAKLANERDEERAKANEWLAQAHDARAQLAALHAAAENRDSCAELCLTMQPYRGCTCGDHRLRAALTDTAAAAKAHDEETAARAVAGVTEERDTLASALAEVREKATPLLDPRQVDGYALERAALRDALSALPVDLAAQHDARVRAEALREARSPCCSAAVRCGRCGHDLAYAPRALADEAEKGGDRD